MGISLAVLFALSFRADNSMAGEELDKPLVTVQGTNLRIKSCEYAERCFFSKHKNVMPPNEKIRPTEGHRFLIVNLEANFPVGPGLEVWRIALKSSRRLFILKGFRSAGPKHGGGPFHRTDTGAGGILAKNGEIIVLSNPLGQGGQLYFAWGKDAEGKPFRWKGGYAQLSVVYELPMPPEPYQIQMLGKDCTAILESELPIGRKPAGAKAEIGRENLLTLDNQSGEEALIRVIGLTAACVTIPDKSCKTLNVAAGSYKINVRYGQQQPFRYSKGDLFEIRETAKNYSHVTITLHKVIGGNYSSVPITAEEFEK
jgi:hypothetical protein